MWLQSVWHTSTLNDANTSPASATVVANVCSNCAAGLAARVAVHAVLVKVGCLGCHFCFLDCCRSDGLLGQPQLQGSKGSKSAVVRKHEKHVC